MTTIEVDHYNIAFHISHNADVFASLSRSLGEASSQSGELTSSFTTINLTSYLHYPNLLGAGVLSQDLLRFQEIIEAAIHCFDIKARYYKMEI